MKCLLIFNNKDERLKHRSIDKSTIKGYSDLKYIDLN